VDGGRVEARVNSLDGENDRLKTGASVQTRECIMGRDCVDMNGVEAVRLSRAVRARK
jgi:hypothetical protein